MSHGFVYLARNASMPGLYKIGSTSNSPTFRIRQLSSSTSVPSPFELMGYCEIEIPRNFEAQLHKDYAEYRNSKNREFFRLSDGILDDLRWLFSISGNSHWIDADAFDYEMTHASSFSEGAKIEH